jgi:hypothetical protein
MSGYNDGPIPGAPDVVIHFAGSFSPSETPFFSNVQNEICTLGELEILGDLRDED